MTELPVAAGAQERHPPVAVLVDAAPDGRRHRFELLHAAGRVLLLGGRAALVAPLDARVAAQLEKMGFSV